MPSSLSPVRLWITAGVLLCSLLLMHSVSHGEPVVPHQPLPDLPYTLGTWKGTEQPLPREIVEVVGVTDYVNRIYFEGAGPAVQLYVGYYSTQRTGDTIHSPKNCLPGAGWEPLSAGYATVFLMTSRQIIVNDYIIQKDLNKQVVWYWYQGRGHVIASEYSSKFWMVADAISRDRTDGALVRLVTSMNDGEAKARKRLMSFTQSLFPEIDAIIPK